MPPASASPAPVGSITSAGRAGRSASAVPRSAGPAGAALRHHQRRRLRVVGELGLRAEHERRLALGHACAGRRAAPPPRSRPPTPGRPTRGRPARAPGRRRPAPRRAPARPSARSRRRAASARPRASPGCRSAAASSGPGPAVGQHRARAVGADQRHDDAGRLGAEWPDHLDAAGADALLRHPAGRIGRTARDQPRRRPAGRRPGGDVRGLAAGLEPVRARRVGVARDRPCGRVETSSTRSPRVATVTSCRGPWRRPGRARAARSSRRRR